MIWKEVVKKYGQEMADKMDKSKYLQGITISHTREGQADIPERDIELAYKDVKGYDIHVHEWD